MIPNLTDRDSEILQQLRQKPKEELSALESYVLETMSNITASIEMAAGKIEQLKSAMAQSAGAYRAIVAFYAVYLDERMDKSEDK